MYKVFLALILLTSFSSQSVGEEKSSCDCEEKSTPNARGYWEEAKGEKLKFGVFRKPNTVDSIQLWLAQGNDPLKVKEIYFDHQDANLEDFRPFKNLDKLTIQMAHGNALEGISMFPHLRHLDLRLTSVDYVPELEELKYLEVLEIRKGHLSGEVPPSFLNGIKNLVIYYAAIGDDTLSLDQATCLQELEIEGNINKHFDLSDIDFQQMPCLKKMRIINTYGKATGFPQNLENSDLAEFGLVQIKMTPEEKRVYDAYKR